MNVYTVTREFAAPQIPDRLEVGDTIGQIVSRGTLLIGGVEYTNHAFYDWVGSADSLNYLLFVGAVPDPGLPGVPNVKGGSVSIGNGDDEVTVTGAAWGFIPSGIAVVVTKPDGGDNLFATVRSSTITADGFTADLSAPTSDAGYTLFYVVVE